MNGDPELSARAFGHVTQERIIEIASYWIYEKDIPARFSEEWRRLFQFSLPRE
jgi:hypothetical protein